MEESERDEGRKERSEIKGKEKRKQEGEKRKGRTRR